MHTQPYALNSNQRHQLHRLHNGIRIAIPIPIDAPETFDLELFVLNSLPREKAITVSDVTESSLAVTPSTHPDRLGHILRDNQLSEWHFAVPVVLATLVPTGKSPQKVHPNPQWPGDLSLIYRDQRPELLESHRC